MPTLPKTHPLAIGSPLSLKAHNKSVFGFSGMSGLLNETGEHQDLELFQLYDSHNTWCDPVEVEEALDNDPAVLKCAAAVAARPTAKTMQALERAVLDACNNVVLTAIAQRFADNAATFARYIAVRDAEYPNGRTLAQRSRKLNPRR